MNKAKQITLCVSGNTTVDYTELVEDNEYVNRIRDLIQHDVAFDQCVTELTSWVNINY
jgi:hypothetical protein